MMRVFICPRCGRERVVSKFLQAECYRCGVSMFPCHLSYLEWVELDEKEREDVRSREQKAVLKKY